MSPIVTLSCPSCGAQLRITDNVERFVCVHCGTEQIVRRIDGSVYIKPIIDNLNNIKRESEVTLEFLRVKRINEEIKFIKKERKKEKRGFFIILLISGFFSALFIFGVISGIVDGFGKVDIETIFGLIIGALAGILSLVVIFLMIKVIPKSRKEYLQKIKDKERELQS